MKLKVDFHTHTSDDPKDYIDFSSEELIDRAAGLGFDALAITNHYVISFNHDLEKYAAERGLLLIPGVELTLSGSHVVIINPDFKQDLKMRSLADLAARVNSPSLVIAPHAYYPGFKCLRTKLEENIAAFDAVEHSFYYNHFINPNRKAIRVARDHGKPLVGSSDCHNIWQVGYTYSLVEAEKSIPSIIAAVKNGNVEVATTPLPMRTMVRVGINWVLGDKLHVHLKI
ncbi:MAG: PHP domain-containing protein [Candidatus Aminicenantales bacterium]